MTAPWQRTEPICVRMNDAARMIGVRRTKLYALIASGEVETVKLGHASGLNPWIDADI